VNRFQSIATRPGQALATPIIHWAAVSSGAVIGVGAALLAGSLWSAAAFSSQNSAFYNNLAWWFGGTLIAVSFLAALVAAGLSSARGPTAGLANGLASWGASSSPPARSRW